MGFLWQHWIHDWMISRLIACDWNAPSLSNQFRRSTWHRLWMLNSFLNVVNVTIYMKFILWTEWIITDDRFQCTVHFNHKFHQRYKDFLNQTMLMFIFVVTHKLNFRFLLFKIHGWTTSLDFSVQTITFDKQQLMQKCILKM